MERVHTVLIIHLAPQVVGPWQLIISSGWVTSDREEYLRSMSWLKAWKEKESWRRNLSRNSKFLIIPTVTLYSLQGWGWKYLDWDDVLWYTPLQFGWNKRWDIELLLGGKISFTSCCCFPLPQKLYLKSVDCALLFFLVSAKFIAPLRVSCQVSLFFQSWL